MEKLIKAAYATLVVAWAYFFAAFVLLFIHNPERLHYIISTVIGQ